MNVTIREIETSVFTSFVLFKEFDLEELKKEKKVLVTANRHTKTRVSTDMQFKDACNKINIQIPGYKFDLKEQRNYFSRGVQQNYYFKKSKQQEKAAYLSYLKELVPYVLKEYFNLDMDEITIEFIDSD
ncbi:hypothetical protein [Dysgonomonas sp. ZJ709]|uniref:hypothetical protein n=1 Tax=Dysgonomonas sp. ZJ709 TaxID=2709797 RepID=UPI0013EE2195|nr:hypothetical protein [Dysgonomonas sp. ZJ709]